DARGYRLSGREEQFAEYQAAFPSAKKAASHLIDVTRDHPRQQIHALELEALVENRLDELQRLIDVQHNLGMAEAQREGLKSLGFDQMQRLNALIDAVLTQE